MLASANPKKLPVADYKVIAEVQNLHIGGRKVHKGDVVSLTEPHARHWVNEQVIEPVTASSVTTAAPAAAPTAAPVKAL